MESIVSAVSPSKITIFTNKWSEIDCKYETKPCLEFDIEIGDTIESLSEKVLICLKKLPDPMTF